MKIIHVIHSLKNGGAEKQCNILINELSKKGVINLVVCCDSDGHFLDSSNHLFVVGRSRKWDVDFYFKLRNIVKKERPDIIHLWLPAFVTIPAMFVGFFNAPTLFSYRNKMYFNRPLAMLEWFVALVVCKSIVSNNSISQSRFLYRWLYNIKKGYTIPNAVYVNDSEYVKIQRHEKKIISVGRLSAQKNFEILIKSVAKIRNRDDWILEIYGQGKLADKITKLINSLGLQKRVLLKGVSNNISDVMNSSDLLVFPSLYEGMPNVLVEAMACKLPVLASCISANTLLVGERRICHWINPVDQEEITSKINLFLDNPVEYHRLVDDAYTFSQAFTPEKMGSEYLKLYSSIISK